MRPDILYLATLLGQQLNPITSGRGEFQTIWFAEPCRKDAGGSGVVAEAVRSIRIGHPVDADHEVIVPEDLGHRGNADCWQVEGVDGLQLHLCLELHVLGGMRHLEV